MLIGISSAVTVKLNPIADSFNDPIFSVQPENSRTADGSLRRANEPKLQRWEFEVGWVSKSDAMYIQSWWMSQTSLLLWPDEVHYPNSAYSVAILNETKPMDEWQKPYYNYYRKGDIIIETVKRIN